MALLGASTLVNNFAAHLIGRSEDESTRRRALIGAVAFDLALLGTFKYLGFFVSSVDDALNGVGLGSPLPLVQLVLPVGISFFTFQSISYVIDVYRRAARPVALLTSRSCRRPLEVLVTGDGALIPAQRIYAAMAEDFPTLREE